ncbi:MULTISPECIES: Rieske (2Fe-2S) protein [unclassified Gordonia (in: high G+C Gram-positive bacteria)]
MSAPGVAEFVVGNVSDIPCGEGRTFAVNGTQIAVFRLPDGSLRALDAVCPHRGGPLADALIDDGVAVCPLHNYTYDLTTGAEKAYGGVGVRAYPVRADESGAITVEFPDTP